MDKKGDSALYLMQDIKELLLGIGLILASVALSCLGGVAVFLSGYYGGIWEFAAVIIWVVSAIVLLCGFAYVWHGWTEHKVVSEETKRQEDSHAL